MPRRAQRIEHPRIEVQPRRRSRHGAGRTRINGLVARFVVGIRLVLDVRRQRHRAVALEHLENIAAFELQVKEAAVLPQNTRLHGAFQRERLALAGRMARPHLHQRFVRCRARARRATSMRPPVALPAAEARLDDARVVQHDARRAAR